MSKEFTDLSIIVIFNERVFFLSFPLSLSDTSHESFFLYIFSYEEQLLRKMDEVSLLVKRLGSEIARANPDLAGVVNARIAEQGSVAVIQDIIRSPVIRGYRNKCEFSIGYSNTENVNSAKEESGDTEVDKSVDPEEKIVGLSEKKISVGFRLSTYKQGNS